MGVNISGFCLVWFGVCLGVKNEVVYEMSERLMEKLAIEAFRVAMVSISSSFIWFFLVPSAFTLFFDKRAEIFIETNQGENICNKDT